MFLRHGSLAAQLKQMNDDEDDDAAEDEKDDDDGESEELLVMNCNKDKWTMRKEGALSLKFQD